MFQELAQTAGILKQSKTRSFASPIPLVSGQLDFRVLSKGVDFLYIHCMAFYGSFLSRSFLVSRAGAAPELPAWLKVKTDHKIILRYSIKLVS